VEVRHRGPVGGDQALERLPPLHVAHRAVVEEVLGHQLVRGVEIPLDRRRFPRTFG